MKTSNRTNSIALLIIIAAICALIGIALHANGQPATAPATITLPDGTDLSTFKDANGNGFLSGNHYVAANGKPTYRISRGLHLTNLPNLSIRLLGNKVNTAAAPGDGTTITIRNCPGIEIAGMDIVSATDSANFIDVIASPHSNIHDLTSEVRVSQMAQYDQQSDWATASRVIAKVPTGSRLLYFVGTQHVICQYCQNAGSLGEDGIRTSQWVSQDGTQHRNPRFILISHCTLQTIAQLNKQSALISLRNAGDGTPDDFAEISDCVFLDPNKTGGYIRAGQEAKTPTVFNLKFNRNVIGLDRNGLTQLQLKAATLKEFDGNKFYVTTAQRPADWDHFSCQVCIPTNNTILTMDPTVTAKQLMMEVRTFSATNGLGTTVKLRPDYVPPPRTQPATRP